MRQHVGTLSARAAAALALVALCSCAPGGTDPAGSATGGGAAGVPVTGAAAPGTTADPAESTAAPASESLDPSAVATDAQPTPSETTGADDGRATVVTTYAGVLTGGTAVEAGGYVDVVEDDGTCTLTLTRGEVTRQASAPVTPDGTTASCGGLAVPLSELDAGTWQAVVSYRSARSAGSAAAIDVVVP